MNQALADYKIIKESDGKYNKTDETLDYDSEDVDEYFSIVENAQGLDEGVRVVVTKIEITVDAVANVKNHLKTDEINDFGLNIDKEALKKQGVIAKLEISLVDINDQKLSAEHLSGIYKISFLLPVELRNSQNIRVVFLDENNNLTEVFETSRDGNWITFETEHFSGFYLVADEDQTINLWWLIILLSVLILIEIAVIILKLKKDRDKKKNSQFAMLAVTIIPVNAWSIISALAISALGLAGYIIYLFLRDKKSPKEHKKNDNNPKPGDTAEVPSQNSEPN